MQPGTCRKKNSGFTIFEVAMAAAVMALAISSALLVMSRGFASLDSARCISYASQIMQSELEKMRLTHWGNGTAAGNATPDPITGLTTGVTSYPTTSTAVTIDSSFTTPGDIGNRMTLTLIATLFHTAIIQITLPSQSTTF